MRIRVRTAKRFYTRCLPVATRAHRDARAASRESAACGALPALLAEHRHRDVRDDVAVQSDRDLVVADRFQRALRKPDRGALDLVPEPLQRLGDVVRRDRAEEPTVDAGLARDLDHRAVDLCAALRRGRERFGLRAFELGAAALELGEILGGRSLRLALRNQEVPREAVLHLDDITEPAEVDDLL